MVFGMLPESLSKVFPPDPPVSNENHSQCCIWAVKGRTYLHNDLRGEYQKLRGQVLLLVSIRRSELRKMLMLNRGESPYPGVAGAIS